MSSPGARRKSRRTAWQRLRRRLKPVVLRNAGVIAGPVYRAWMSLVWHTSRHVDHGIEALLAQRASKGRVVCLMWHEELFAAPYVYARLGIRGHALVSRSGVGEFATQIAEVCGHTVSRGGSSRGARRSRPTAIRGVIRWMRENENGIFATPVDGSHGPRYRMKPGSLLVARSCDATVVCVRLWFRRCLRLPTWDQAAIPLPFGEIHVYAGEPRPLPHDPAERDALETIRLECERELVALALRSHADTRTRVPKRLSERPRDAHNGAHAPSLSGPGSRTPRS